MNIHIIEPLGESLTLHIQTTDIPADCECETNLEVCITDKDGTVFDSRTVTMSAENYSISAVSDLSIDIDDNRTVSDSPELEQQIFDDLLDIWSGYFVKPERVREAAPEMLESLEGLIAAFDSDLHELMLAKIKAKAAIAKAKGGNQ
tara:strand:+ start:33 stop:473 length:441 start_codon:yes stop_codon:yes gene_type:complete